MPTDLHIKKIWGRFSALWKWVTSVSVGIAAIIGAYFSIVGMATVIDSWVVTEAEAEERDMLIAQNSKMVTDEIVLVLQALRLSLDSERRQREIEDTVNELRRIIDVVSYLNNLSSRSPDQVEQLRVLRLTQERLRERVTFLRCLDTGTPIEEC